MRTEALLFAGVAAFFAVAGAVYGWLSADPTGTCALGLAFLMAALVAFFLGAQYRRRGPRPQDRPDAEVADATGPVEFFPPYSPWPLTTAAGFTLLCLGVVYGLWLFLLGLGLVSHGVFGMAFQYADRSGSR
ncbi:cytochrome c oxidase polypeptide 4 [Streptomyces sulfonofaciens]|uniref:Cytochrome c oxidase polypeptide 4 n=1 Tax=Streptomyces sulfonofaciens TaxID=68272 RepID=A0A919GMQ1_9ACTN|nr:cytochrome c oxidase subunit 4 [Streptomyces sulfonofaciens]GHH87665.1 cytochrome c oxidase polypeptide 4 [Streptomyces sulfonofaciens]